MDFTKLATEIKNNAALVATLLVLGLVMVGMGDALQSLLFASFLAYWFFPIIHRAERLNIPREFSIITVFCLIVVLFTLLGIWLVPKFIIELKNLLIYLPDTITHVFNHIADMAKEFGLTDNADINELRGWVIERLPSFSANSASRVAQTVKSVVQNMTGFILGLINVLLFPLFFYYLIHDYETVTGFIKKIMPANIYPGLAHFTQQCNRILSGYIRGQFIVALVLSIVYSVGLALIGVPFGWVIGLITGLLSIIPYVGLLLGLITSLISVTAADPSWIMYVKVLLLFAGAHVLENLFITPKLVGDKVGISPLMSIIAAIIGGNLGGIWGIILAVPVAGIIRLIVHTLLQKKQEALKENK